MKSPRRTASFTPNGKERTEDASRWAHAEVASPVASKPGPSPPYQALTITAAQKRAKAFGSISGQRSSEAP